MNNISLLGLNIAQGFKIIGNAASDNAGNSVSSVGDINGDGMSDLIIGATGASPNGRIHAGAAYVIYGSNDITVGDIDLASFTGTRWFKIIGSAAGDYAGYSVSNAGDVNGDGLNDLIVGAGSASPSGRTGAGAAYVIYGSKSAAGDIDLANLPVAQGFKIIGSVAGDQVGISVSSAGDVNGDGLNDVIVGARLVSPSGRIHAGAAYVIYGSKSAVGDIDLANLPVAQGFKIIGSTAGDQAGISVNSAGDVNGDLVSDLIVGAYNASPNGRNLAGTAYVIYGSKNAVGDIDLANLSVAQGFKIIGAATGDATGNSVSNAGDVNGDGVSDIIVGAENASPSGRNKAGAAYVIYGSKAIVGDIDLASLPVARGFRIIGAVGGFSFLVHGDSTGYSVSGAGDINGDGVGDLIVGAPNANPTAGVAYVIYGANNTVGDIDLASLTTTQGFKIIGSGGYTGNSVSSGDVNGDGVSDLIIGAYQASPSGKSQAGTAYVIYGRKVITGTTGNDIIFPSKALEDIDGLSGINTASYANSTAGVAVSLVSGIVGVGGYAAGDTITNFENIIGSSFADTLTGDTNANNIQGGAGADMLDGGDGIDTISYATSNAAVIVNLSTNMVSGGDATGDVISNFENIIGSSFADTLTGDINANNIQGGAGNDLIEGKAGSDILDGGDGTDTVSYISSAANVTVSLVSGVIGVGGDATGDSVSNFENIIGSAFSDTLTGDVNANNIQGGAGDDIIEGKAGSDILDGGTGTNTVSYASSTDGVIVNLVANTVSGGDATGDSISNFKNIIGSAFSDSLTGDANANIIQSGDGDDIIEGKEGNDALDGGAGTDTLSYASSTAGVTVNLATNAVSGGDATGDVISNFENIIGSAFSDNLSGDSNANNIQGGAGADNIDGGGGTDTINYISSPAGVTVNLLINTASGGDATGDIISNFENIIGSAFADILIGDDNDNIIQGGDGDDIIEGKSGSDVLDGGAGTDTIIYASSTAGVTTNLSTNTVSGGDATGDSISNFENIIGSSFADILIGDDNDNNIQGGDGDDIIEGKVGSDVLDGGAGTDTLSYASSTAGVTVDLLTNAVSDGDATGDTISNFENIIGSGFADTLTGDANDNNIQAGDGDDTLKDGNGGNDVLTGGRGADNFIISSSSGAVTITDFNIAEEDKIDFGQFNLGFTHVMNSAVNNGANCEITLGSKKVILLNINKDNIQQPWFTSLMPDIPATQEIAKWPTTQDIIKITTSICSATISVGGFAYKSYQYYKPTVLGHNHYYSFASSMVPKLIIKTTANTIKAADNAIQAVINLQTQYTEINSQLVYEQLQTALVKAAHSCSQAVTEAKVIQEAAKEVLLTAKGKTAEAAKITLSVAAAAFDLYTKSYNEYINAIKTTSIPENIELHEIVNPLCEAPIGIALGSDKIDLVSLKESNTSFDYLDNGTKTKTSWVGPKDAFLIYDHNDNKQVDAAKELVLTKWSKTAITDFMALKEVFDSNQDNKFDANDAEFDKFYIWQDHNQDGVSQNDELTLLKEAGLVQIDFDTEYSISDKFFGTQQQEIRVAGVLWEGGQQTLAYDLMLETRESQSF